MNALDEHSTELNRILSYVENISIELATLPNEQEIYPLITGKLKEATGAIGTTFGEYDPDKLEIVLKHIETDSEIINAASKVLGYSLIDIRSHTKEQLYNEMVTNQVKITQTLSEVTFGEISPTVSKIFMKAMNIDYFAGMAYVVEGKLYGTSVLAFRKDTPEPSLQMLKALSNIIAVSLRRRKTEIDLQNSVKALQMSEEKFRNISEQLSDTIFLTDTHGTILYLSPSSKQLFGYEPKEMLGKNFILFLHKSDITKALTRFQKAVNTSETRTPLVLKMVRKKEDFFYGELVSANVHEEGKISGTLGIIRDITDRITVEDEIKKLNEELELRVQMRTAELEAANRELEAFSYSVSHDLRGPLRTISGFSSILIEDNHQQINAEGQLNLKRIVDATHYMGQLIDDLLNLSRIQKAGINPVNINISKLVQSEFDALIQAEPDRNVSLDIKEGIEVKGDNNLIHNVIQNLVNNAWKFTSTQKIAKIQFGTINKDDKQVCFIKDNGVGFDMNYYHKLFNPFQRLHARNDFPGTGIGLASVKRIIKKHNGDIWAESQIDKGTTFYFYLAV